MATNFNGNFVGTGSSVSNVNAQLLDGYNSTEIERDVWRTISVGGDATVFYPLVFDLSGLTYGETERIEVSDPSVHNPSTWYGSSYIKFHASRSSSSGPVQVFKVDTYIRGGSNIMFAKLDTFDGGNKIALWVRNTDNYRVRTTSDIMPTLNTTSSLSAVAQQFFSEGNISGLRREVVSDASGNVTMTGDANITGEVVAYYSDNRLKDFKGNIDSPLEKLKSLNGYYYTANQTAIELGFSDTGRQVGVSAQEVESVMPEVVTEAEHGYKTVQYSRLVPLLIEAVNEIKQKTDNASVVINALRGDK